MTLEQKIGQLLVFGFSGTYPHLDILKMIEQYHVAGFRVSPMIKKFSRYFGDEHPGSQRVKRSPETDERLYTSTITPPKLTAPEYAGTLNVLKQRALETGAGIPLLFSLDYEGALSADVYSHGFVTVPSAMGMAASGNPDLCRQMARMVGEQLRATGINWIHSPCVDVNTHPDNPEIGVRSYSPLPDVASEFGLQAMHGLKEGGLIATAKHFPGRGHSTNDAHFDVPIIGESAERMRDIHLAPYRTLIKEGLQSIMLAHSVYPSLDKENEIATLSKSIVTGVLREELGYENVVMTDSFTMGGLVAKYEVVEAAIRSIEAGVDLILLKDENALRGEVYEGLLHAVKSKRISEERLHESVCRVLRAKEQNNLFDKQDKTVDPDHINTLIRQPERARVARETGRATVCILRSDNTHIPLPAEKRILVVEEADSLMGKFNNIDCHPGLLFESLVEHGQNVTYVDYDRYSLEKAWPIIQERANDADVLVLTAYYHRGRKTFSDWLSNFQHLNKPLVFVSNNPYPNHIPREFPTVILSFSPWRDSAKMVADILTGKAKPSGKIGFDPEKVY